MSTEIPSVFRGHGAENGSEAELLLCAWAELMDSTEDPAALRAELARVKAKLDGERPWWERPWWAHLDTHLPARIERATERQIEADALLLRARYAPGYLGEEG